MDYIALRAADLALPGQPGLSLSAAWSGLSAQTVTLPPQDISWAAIRDIFVNQWDLGRLVACTMTPGANVFAPGGGLITGPIKSAADAFLRACDYGGMMNTSNATVWGKLTADAALLTPTAIGGLSSASVAAVLALRTPTVAKWPGLTMGDIQLARAQA